MQARSANTNPYWITFVDTLNDLYDTEGYESAFVKMPRLLGGFLGWPRKKNWFGIAEYILLFGWILSPLKNIFKFIFEGIPFIVENVSAIAAKKVHPLFHIPQYLFKFIRYLICPITSPVVSAKKAWKIHPVLGVLSAIYSAAVVVTIAVLLAPLAVPYIDPSPALLSVMTPAFNLGAWVAKALGFFSTAIVIDPIGMLAIGFVLPFTPLPAVKMACKNIVNAIVNFCIKKYSEKKSAKIAGQAQADVPLIEKSEREESTTSSMLNALSASSGPSSISNTAPVIDLNEHEKSLDDDHERSVISNDQTQMFEPAAVRSDDYVAPSPQ